jgi:taurine dioxygenase
MFETIHPVVRVHPESGERGLFLGGFARYLLGLGGSDARSLIEVFESYVTRPENTVRWQWAPGDVAIWDERTTQHYGIYDYGDERRVMRRVTVAGEVPVGADGDRSRAIQGDASAYDAAG